MEILEITRRYGTQRACIAHLEKLRWDGEPVCPYCGSRRSTGRKDGLRHLCRDCNRSYSVLVGTVMEATKLALPKWFAAICLIVNAKKGISSLQLSRDLGVNKNTAWYLQKRIREAMGNDGSGLLKGIVEADETYVGGSIVHKTKSQRAGKEYFIGGMEHKTPVLGMLARKGRISVQVLKKAWGKEIKPILKERIGPDSTLVTDGFGGYSKMDGHFDKHVVLNKAQKKYTLGRYHTNTIEGFWSMLKRAIVGQYHKINIEHLQGYVDELAFKYNHRNNEKSFEILICNCINTKMPLSRK